MTKENEEKSCESPKDTGVGENTFSAAAGELSDDQIDKAVGGIYDPNTGKGWWAEIVTNYGRFVQCIALEDTEENLEFLRRCYYENIACSYYSGPEPGMPVCSNRCKWCNEGAMY